MLLDTRAPTSTKASAVQTPAGVPPAKIDVSGMNFYYGVHRVLEQIGVRIMPNQINTDLERVGDLAVNIGEAARRYASHVPVKKLIDIPLMASIAQAMLRDALDAFVRRDLDLAQQVLNADDRLDSLKTQIFRELLTYMLQDPTTIEPALDLILVSRHLERIGDHATNIAEDVIFMVSARDVRHHAADPAQG
jgi:phosphate transport system regulatory protein PhoU